MEAWLERVDWNWEREPVRTARWTLPQPQPSSLVNCLRIEQPDRAIIVTSALGANFDDVPARLLKRAMARCFPLAFSLSGICS